MYKVFLVDDEIVVRQAIRNNIDWEAAKYSFSGEAADGEMALAIMQDIKPDILITDIKMPFLGGLELSRIIRRTMPWVKIIILSGHDEFEYAKQAISIGVEEYMLKPINSAELLGVLNRIAAQIEREKSERLQLLHLKKQIHSSANMLKNKLMNDLFMTNFDMGAMLAQAHEANIELIAKCYIVAVMEFTVHGETYEALIFVETVVSSIIQNRTDIIGIFLTADRAAFLLKGESDEGVEDCAYELAQAVKYEVERNTHCNVAIGISQAVGRMTEIPKCYADADRARRHLVSQGLFHINGIDEIECNALGELIQDDPIAEKLKYATEKDIPLLFEQYMQSAGKSAKQSVMIGYYKLIELLLGCARIVNSLGGDAEQLLPEMKSIDKYADVVQSPDKLTLLVYDILKRTFDFRDNHANDRFADIIRKAKAYIDVNYAQPDISLHLVAKEVALSPNHFSTMFSQKTGSTFIEYLTQVRIAQAKRLLLCTDLRAGDIACEVGYNEPHYFSYIFKKNTGITPREFRKQASTLCMQPLSL